MRHVVSVFSVFALTLCACGSDSTSASGNPNVPDAGGGGSSGTGGSGGVDGGVDGAPDAPSVDQHSGADVEKEADLDAPFTDVPSEDAGPIDPEVDPVELTQEDAQYCARAQREVENFAASALPNDLIDVQTLSDLNAFTWSKPQVSGGKVVVRSYRPTEVECCSDYAQAWCKMKTQAAIQDGLSAIPDGPSGSCKLMNEAAIAWALDHVSASMKQAWEARGIAIDHVDDEVHSEGSKWIPSNMVIERKDSGTIRIRSSALRIDLNLPLVGRVHYCKVLSPEGAVALVSDVANGVNIGSMDDE